MKITKSGLRISAVVALTLVGAGSPGLAEEAATPQPAPASAAPRAADGHPDLSGYWSNGFGGLQTTAAPPQGQNYTTVLPVRNGDISNLTNDGVIARRSTDNLPLYKPEYWSRVLEMDWNGNQEDPFNSCMPPSVPRMGPPRRIVQMGDEVFLFYAIIFQRNDYRDVPIGERKHPVDRDGTYLGDPAAHWEGDTLVVVTEGFNDQSWIGPQGYIHGYDMKVTERFHRDGDTLDYDVTVEDPEYLQRPWVFNTAHLKRINTPDYRMEESPPCSDRDNKNLVGKQREM
jgi:hypothetical protein